MSRHDVWEHVGVVGVDAGLVMVGDPCYTHKHPANKWNKFCDDELAKSDDSYQLNYPGGHPGLGVIVQSGYGDGEYPVYIRRENGAVAEVRVVFIENDDDQ